jgi:hypothetical protein
MEERTYPYSGLKVKQSDSQKGSTTLLGKIPPTVLPDIAARSTRVDTHVPAISSSRGALHPSQNQATRKGRNTTSYEIIFSYSIRPKRTLVQSFKKSANHSSNLNAVG